MYANTSFENFNIVCFDFISRKLFYSITIFENKSITNFKKLYSYTVENHVIFITTLIRIRNYKYKKND